jgi:hypothetical protein
VNSLAVPIGAGLRRGAKCPAITGCQRKKALAPATSMRRQSSYYFVAHQFI